MDRGKVDHLLAASDGPLIIFAEPPVSAKPRKRSLDHPAPREHLESVLVLFTLDDLKQSVEGFLYPTDELAGIGPIGPDLFDLLLGLLPQAVQKRTGAVSILNVSGMNNDSEHVLSRVCDHVALASPNALPSVVTARAAGLGGLDALAVEDRSGWFGFSVSLLAFLFAQSSVDPAPRAVETLFSVMVVDAVGIWVVIWEFGLLASSTQNVQDGVDHFSDFQLHRAASALLLSRKDSTDQIPLFIGQIGSVAV